MDPHTLSRPAKLLIWRTGLDSTGLHEAATYDTLAVAIAAASGVLGDADAYPWIVTEDGDILTPQWIATYLDGGPDTAPAPPRRPRAATSDPRRSPARGWRRFLRPAPYRLAFAR